MKQLSIAIACGVGIVVLADFFFTHPVLDALGATFREWAILLTAFALLLGMINLLLVHGKRIVRRDEGGSLGYSLIVLITATVVAVIGFLYGLPSSEMTWIFDTFYAPLQSTLYALLAFFLASAAYRAMRAKSIETFWMVVAALVVFIGQTPLLNVLSEAKDWVLRVPAEAGIRGIMIGVALGTIATGLRLLIGLDRPYSE